MIFSTYAVGLVICEALSSLLSPGPAKKSPSFPSDSVLSVASSSSCAAYSWTSPANSSFSSIPFNSFNRFGNFQLYKVRWFTGSTFILISAFIFFLWNDWPDRLETWFDYLRKPSQLKTIFFKRRLFFLGRRFPAILRSWFENKTFVPWREAPA